jgi:hypothetical protein
MPKRGRRLASTRKQREEVLRLVSEGTSRRAVAQRVFGNERLRGRVDRIVNEARLGSRRSEAEKMAERLVESPPDAAGADEDTPTLDDLVAHYARQLQQRLDDPAERVSAGELLTFAKLELLLENKHRVERLNRLTRELDA